ncbi:MAG: hypothetical protein WKF63_09780, partial [Thermomicrobiales bacterium]
SFVIPTQKSCISWQKNSASSNSFAVSRFIKIHSLFIDRLPEIGISDLWIRHQVDAASKQVFQRIYKREIAPGDAVFVVAEIDDEVEVARFRVEGAGSSGAEEVEALDVVVAAEGGDLVFAVGNQGDHGGRSLQGIAMQGFIIHDPRGLTSMRLQEYIRAVI